MKVVTPIAVCLLLAAGCGASKPRTPARETVVTLGNTQVLTEPPRLAFHLIILPYWGALYSIEEADVEITYRQACGMGLGELWIFMAARMDPGARQTIYWVRPIRI